MNWRILMVTIFTIIIVTSVTGFVLTTDAVNRVNTSVSNLNRVVTSLGNKPATELTLADFQRVSSSIDDLLYNLTTAKRQVTFLRPFGSLNTELRTNFEALDTAEELALAAHDVLDGLEPTLFFLVAGDDKESVISQISSGERVIELLRIGRPRFVSADQHLTAARNQLDTIDFSNISPSLLLNLQILKRYQEQFQNINSLLTTAPEPLAKVLGLDNSQSYLILAQNNDELRPSGGYISTYGWMTVRNGRIADYNYSSTTAISPNPPDTESPYPVPKWWIKYDKPLYAAWDGSWYANFQKTAEMARWYYNSGNNPQSPIDGLISIDITGFEYILAVLGEVSIPQYGAVVTKDNFRQVVYDIRSYGQEESAHKEFVAAVYRQIFGNWQDLSSDQTKSAELLGATIRALQEKHMMLYFADPQLQRVVDVLGWSGSQNEANNTDYLMAADANLGNKSNHSIIRQMVYDVTVEDDGRLSSRATITYDYPRALAEKDPAIDPNHHGPLDYNSLLQLFTPSNSQLVSDTADDVLRIENEGDAHTIFVTQIAVPYDDGQRFQLVYHTPPLIENLGTYHRYRLLLQKQPGMAGEVVNVQITLPANATVVNTAPEAAASYNLDHPILEFRTELVTDQWIEVIYRD